VPPGHGTPQAESVARTSPSTSLSRMPIFAYLSDEEAAAAYLYLAYLPPQQAK
jgi:hypothetical protein